jgi:hypothetical protein
MEIAKIKKYPGFVGFLGIGIFLASLAGFFLCFIAAFFALGLSLIGCLVCTIGVVFGYVLGSKKKVWKCALCGAVIDRD